MEQALALRSYAAILRKGYVIAGQGLEVFRGLSQQEGALHALFFSGLKQVNPRIKTHPQISEILEMQRLTLQALQHLPYPKDLQHREIAYLNRMKRQVMQACMQDLDKLRLLSTPNQVELSDEGRIQGLEKLHQVVWDKLQFTRWLATELQAWTKHKTEIKRGQQILRSLYEPEY